MKPREWTIERLESGAADGGDIFAVVAAKQKVSFNEICNGIQVVDKSAYDLLMADVSGLIEFINSCIPDENGDTAHEHLGDVANSAYRALAEWNSKHGESK
jgi:hypothetical protein